MWKDAFYIFELFSMQTENLYLSELKTNKNKS